MKSFYIAMLLLLVVVAVTVIHISTVNSFQSEGSVILQNLDAAVSREDFTSAKIELDKFENFYRQYRRWFALFLDTADLEMKELHVARMRQFLIFEAKQEFYNEFIGLREIINALPYREGVHFEVLF